MVTLPRASRPTSPPRIDLLAEPPALYKTQVTQQKLVKFASRHRQLVWCQHLIIVNINTCTTVFGPIQNVTAFIDCILGY